MRAFLAAANLLGWSVAWLACVDHPALLGVAMLAWVLGLRHTVDADHIAGNRQMRKFMEQGQRPLTVGLYVSLGFSTMVEAALGVICCRYGFEGCCR